MNWIRSKLWAKAAVRIEHNGRQPHIHILRRRMGQSHQVTWRNRTQDLMEWRRRAALSRSEQTCAHTSREIRHGKPVCLACGMRFFTRLDGTA